LFYLCFGFWSRDEQERDGEKCYVNARQSLFHSGILTDLSEPGETPVDNGNKHSQAAVGLSIP
jgi:hypothetical protein